MTPTETTVSRWVLASLSLSMLMPSLDTSIANIALPTLAQAFGVSFQTVQWVVLAYLLAITTLIVSAGRLGDLFGRRRLLLIGISLFTAASLLCGMAKALPMLVAARALQGLGAALMMALTLALVGGTIPKARTGSAMGLLGTMSAIGTTLGPSLGGLMLNCLGWQGLFLVNVPVGLLNLYLAWRWLPQDRPAASAPSIDMAGMVVLAATLCAYALAMTAGDGKPGALNAGLLATAMAGFVLFVFIQARTPSPLIQPAIFAKRALSAGLIANGLVAAVMMATLVVGPFYLSQRLGLGAAQMGLVMSVGPLVSAVCGVIAGRIVDRFAAARVRMAALAIILAGAAGLAIAPEWLGVMGYVAAIMILTPGYQLFQAANSTAIVLDIPAERRGVVSSLISLSRNLGLITGAAFLGAVFGTVSRLSGDALAMPVTFAVSAGLIIAALLMTRGIRV